MKSCHCCGLVQEVPDGPDDAVAVCARCETRLKHVSYEGLNNALAAATALSALILFVPAIALPFLRIEQLGHMRENSLVGGVLALFSAGHSLAAVAVFVFAVALPPVKLVALLVLGSIPERLRGKARARTLRAVDLLGRWGTLDVLILVVAVLLAFAPLGEMVRFQPGPGVLAFGLFVLLSLLAGYFFDPHALWDESPMAHDAEHTPPDEGRATDDQNRDREEEQARQPQSHLPSAQLMKPRGPNWLWLLPILALFVVGVLGYREWQRRGTLITVTFSDGRGLEAGDPLRYRGTVVGRVKRLALSSGLNAVRAHVRLQPHAERLARDGSRFWVVRPELSLTKVAGLETLVGTNYLAVLPGPIDGQPQYHFVGVEEAPLRDIRESGGVNIVLNAADASGLSSGSPIHYRQLRVGGVRDLAMASDGSAVEVYAYIRPAFRQLVLPETRFWKSSGIEVKANWSGVTVWAGDLKMLKAAVDTVDGRAAKLSEKKSLLSVDTPKGTMFLVRATGVQNTQLAESIPWLGQLQSFDYCEGIKDGRYFSRITADTGTPTVNRHVKNVVDGVVSAYWLMYGRQDQTQEAQTASEMEMEIAVKGGQVEVTR